jgi:hypothetical protein
MPPASSSCRERIIFASMQDSIVCDKTLARCFWRRVSKDGSASTASTAFHFLACRKSPHGDLTPWLPFLDTYRTMCRAPEPAFRRVLEDIRELRFG